MADLFRCLFAICKTCKTLYVAIIYLCKTCYCCEPYLTDLMHILYVKAFFRVLLCRLIPLYGMLSMLICYDAVNYIMIVSHFKNRGKLQLGIEHPKI
ncbi:hypothetical protein RIF29_12514 [Crotalaria pallida]|uniref:Uncharacterized protein n=1 Tax=Crotalaria pallida TaxID=3830 RepID=A0AAN9INH1_CROPI